VTVDLGQEEPPIASPGRDQSERLGADSLIPAKKRRSVRVVASVRNLIDTVPILGPILRQPVGGRGISARIEGYLGNAG
jgi:hypothetical protein